jgi:hypothetical protein
MTDPNRAQFEKILRTSTGKPTQEEIDQLAETERQQLEMWQSFYAQPGDEFEFRLARSPSAIERDGTATTFSEAAMDALIQHLMVYIGTRLTRYYEANEVMPQTMTVRIKVATDATVTDWGAAGPDIVINAADQDPDSWNDLSNPITEGNE